MRKILKTIAVVSAMFSFVLLLLPCSASSCADVQVSDFKVLKRSTENGVIEFSYTLNGSEADKDAHPVISVACKTGGVYIAKTIDGDLSNKNGSHHISWKPSKDGYDASLLGDTYTLKLKRCPVYCSIGIVDDPGVTRTMEYFNEIPDGAWNDVYKYKRYPLRYIPGNPEAGISNGYYIGVFEVSVGEFRALKWQVEQGHYWDAGANNCPYNEIRGNEKGALWPLSSEVDDDSFLGRLRAFAGEDFDLPTERQWEYACRAGSTSTYYWGNSYDARYLWCYESVDYTYSHPIGEKLPNAWGLYDMLGNVYEWCLEWHSVNETRVMRGGCANSTADKCTVSWRIGSDPNYSSHLSYRGFRMVMIPKDIEAISSLLTEAQYVEQKQSDGMINNVVAQQRNPGIGKLDISYTASGIDEECQSCSMVASLKVYAVEHTSHVTNIAESAYLSGDTVMTNGAHKLVWDMGAQGVFQGLISTNFEIFVSADVSPIGGVQLWKDGPYWAECNVGATKPEEYGYYFWWGDTVGYKRNANNDGWISAKDGTAFIFSVDNCPTWRICNSDLQSQCYIDSSNNLMAAHDSATLHCGAPWRMPTNDEINELKSNCTTTWITTNGVSGRLVVGQGDFASRSIFLPCPGCGDGTAYSNMGSGGYYLSSTPCSDDCDLARILYSGGGNFAASTIRRYLGMSVRPLRESVTRAVTWCASGSGAIRIDTKGVSTISDVVAQQRYPWNGKVDIFYTVPIAGSETHKLSVLAIDLTAGTTNVAKEVSGDTAYTKGRHHVVWNMAADGFTLASSNVVFEVSYQKQCEGRYCVIDLSGGDLATSYPIAYIDDVPSGGWSDEYKTTNLVLRRIEPGTCVVTVDEPYYVGVFEVTQKQYELVTGETPSRFSGGVTRPVECVSYDMIRGSSMGAQYPDSTDVDADSFVGKLRSRTGLQIDLPTEAQWEYAGRAGTTTIFFYGESVDGDYMWYSGNSGSCPHEVGTRKPNDWGLYDVHGNVFELCLEKWEYSSAGLRVLRGGGWFDGWGGCQFGYRAGFDPSDPNDNVGFRLVSATAELTMTGMDATSGCSNPVRIDLTKGTRTAAKTETVSYSTKWADCDSADAVSVVSVNGQVISEATGSGTIEWNPERSGSYQLTHKVMVGGEQHGETLTALFVVGGAQTGGPYKEVVNGVEWTFMVDENLYASVGTGEWSGLAVPVATIGAISIPTKLGGRPVTGIAYRAFGSCGDLTSVSIPTSVVSIGKEAFGGCGGLTGVMIPHSVTNIGDSAFINCDSLKSVDVAAGNSCYMSQNGVLFDKGMRTIVLYPCGKEGSYEIPFGVTSVGACAFYCCRGLTSVILPSSVTSIGEWAFSDCSGLTCLTIPKGVTRLELRAFSGCSGLTSLSIPDGVLDIGDAVFDGCCGLISVMIPESVTSIGQWAFGNCGRLVSITIPAGVTSIERRVFSNCSGLTSVQLSQGVTSIGRESFYGCSALIKVTMPNGVTRIDYDAFKGCSGLAAVDFECPPPIGVNNVVVNADVPIRYNVNYETQWLPVVAECGWTNATSYQPLPSVPGDPGAVATYDPENGFSIKPSAENVDVVVSIPSGVLPDKVTVEVGTNVESVKPNGANVKIVKVGNDITSYLDIPSADQSGTIDLTQTTVKSEIVKEAIDPDKGAKIELNAESPSLTTSETKPGLTYTLHEGATLQGMNPGDSKLGDGQPWTPNISVKGGASGFYSIDVTK